MSVALYADENVNRAIVQGLRLRGVDILSVHEEGRTGDSDEQVLDRATELRRVLFTQDDDFLSEAENRRAAGVSFAGIVYAHQLRMTIGHCVADLEILAGAATWDELKNRVIFLPL